MERIKLVGSKRDQIYAMLSLAGWYENRQVDISEAESYYRSVEIEMFDSIKSFYREFYKIINKWYIKVENPNHAADFEFSLFPDKTGYLEIKDYMYDDADYKVLSAEYKDVLSFAKENCVMVGNIGYYYPARVWMDKYGRFYTTHEYADNVKAFSSVIELIEYELSRIEIDSVMMKIKK